MAEARASSVQQPVLRQTEGGQPVQRLALGEWMRAHARLREIVLINHGEAEVDSRILTTAEAPISSRGREEMILVARRLVDELFNPQAVIVANDQRCIESAEVLRKFFPESHFPTAERLKQKKLPAAVNGKTLQQVREESVRLHEHIAAPYLNPDESFEGGESYRQFFDRVAAVFKRIAENYDVVAAVTHNGNIMAAAGFVLGLDMRVFGNWKGPLNGAVTHILFNKEKGEAAFKKFVEITHLPRELRE